MQKCVSWGRLCRVLRCSWRALWTAWKLLRRLLDAGCLRRRLGAGHPRRRPPRSTWWNCCADNLAAEGTPARSRCASQRVALQPARSCHLAEGSKRSRCRPRQRRTDCSEAVGPFGTDPSAASWKYWIGQWKNAATRAEVVSALPQSCSKSMFSLTPLSLPPPLASRTPAPHPCTRWRPPPPHPNMTYLLHTRSPNSSWQTSRSHQSGIWRTSRSAHW
mmetsp:Transcript_20806/g.65352  ORF Transcript_20806/g.65352 Transcript_20806/m.65352 type:complete len:218 (-) Transcript_20806:1134-1787(-)